MAMTHKDNSEQGQRVPPDDPSRQCIHSHPCGHPTTPGSTRRAGEEYKKCYVAVHVRRALLRLAIEQPKVILDKEGSIIDTVVALATAYAESILKLRETTE